MNDPVILTDESISPADRFLRDHAAGSLILRSNIRKAGIEDHGFPFQGTYAAFVQDGKITGIAAHYWNGMVFIQAPEHAGALVRAAMNASGRNLAGLAGPLRQVREALATLGLAERYLPDIHQELLFSLRPGCLIVPDPLQNGTAVCRLPAPGEREVVRNMRRAYDRECGFPVPGNSGEPERDPILETQLKERNLWVLDVEGEPVSTAALNAALPDIVQIGAVYTLPAYRRRGYARCAVAGVIREVARRGAGDVILFTERENTAAVKAYSALGFQQVGDYAIAMMTARQV